MDQTNHSAESQGDHAGPPMVPRDHWRMVIDQQRKSGLGVSEFCRRESIATSSFYGWRQKLDGTARGRAGDSAGATRARFVPVKVAQAQTRSSSAVAAAAARSGAQSEGESLVVLLRNGRRLQLGQGFDPRLLQQAVVALEGLSLEGGA